MCEPRSASRDARANSGAAPGPTPSSRQEAESRGTGNGLPSGFGFPIALDPSDPDVAYVIPEEGAEDSIAAAELKKHRGHPRRLLGFALLGAVALAVLSSIHLWPSPGNFWVLAALLIAVLAWWRGRVMLGIVAAVLVVLVAGLLLAISVPVFSGVGNRNEAPASITSLHSKYTLGIGKLTLDFSGLQLPTGETFVKATVGIGDLHVIAPANATIDVSARAQAGDVVVLDHKDDGTHVSTRVVDRTGSGRVLVLDLKAGLGKVTVFRG